MKRLKKIIYTSKHKLAFLKVEKQLLGCNTFFGFTHDLGKLLMLLFLPIPMKKISKIHKKLAKHHNAKTRMDYIQKIIDYECARFTKKDKQLSARDFVNSKNWNNEELTKLNNTLQFLGL